MEVGNFVDRIWNDTHYDYVWMEVGNFIMTMFGWKLGILWIEFGMIPIMTMFGWKLGILCNDTHHDYVWWNSETRVLLTDIHCVDQKLKENDTLTKSGSFPTP